MSIETRKIINNLDKNLWRRFVGLCVTQGILVGHKINELIKKEVEQNETRNIRQSKHYNEHNKED